MDVVHSADPFPPTRSARAPDPGNRIMIPRPMSFRVSASDRGWSPNFCFAGRDTLRVDKPLQGPHQWRAAQHPTISAPATSSQWFNQLQHFFQTIGPVIRIEVVCAWTGLSRSTVYERIDENGPRHDPSFPRPFPLTGDRVHSPSRPQAGNSKKSAKEKQQKSKPQGAVGWSSVEVVLWVVAQAAKREGGCK